MIEGGAWASKPRIRRSGSESKYAKRRSSWTSLCRVVLLPCGLLCAAPRKRETNLEGQDRCAIAAAGDSSWREGSPSVLVGRSTARHSYAGAEDWGPWPDQDARVSQNF